MGLEKARDLLSKSPGWSLNEKGWIVKEKRLKDFKEAVAFANKVAELAENEGHHPNIYLHDWNKLRLELYTHSIGGLSENDFIMAAKISKLLA
ncbi:MAG TPA: 4a-hydroxytetrahydrobiopterin dehydratase [archaeon]|nr:4a-hydroxytetrahydrobiopterin dehydratase [archaeon]